MVPQLRDMKLIAAWRALCIALSMRSFRSASISSFVFYYATSGSLFSPDKATVVSATGSSIATDFK